MAVLPVAPALRVVGRSPQTTPQVMDAARAQPYAPPSNSTGNALSPTSSLASPPSGLAGFITDQYSVFRRHRDTVGRGWSDRLLAALRAFNGIYEQAIIEEIKRFGGSNVYSRIVAMKCRGTSSLLRDVYLGTDRPWGIQPASDPDIPPEVMEAIGTVIKGQVGSMIQAHMQAQQANQAHQMGVAAAHAYGAAQGIHPAFIDQAIPSQQSGNAQGHLTGAIPPGAQVPPSTPGPAGLPPPPPIPPLPDPSAIRDHYDMLVEDARDAVKRKAAEQAKIAEDKLEERLAQGGFYHALAEFLVDVPLFPYAVMKGPTVRIKTQVKWTRDVAPWSGAESVPTPPGMGGAGGAQTPSTPGMPSLTPQSNQVAPAPGMPGPQAPPAPGMPGPQAPPTPRKAQVATPQVVDIPMLCWERVSPFDIYWTPGVANVADANIIERSRLTRADINDLLDLPGFNTDEVRAVLDEYGRGGLVDNWDVTDAERAILEGREDPRFNQSGLIACLEFQGMAQGRFLLDLGVDPATIPDPMRDYFCNAWLIGRHVIKVQFSPSPRKRHNYYITSFEKVPGNPCGNGLPDLLADVSSVANATLRALVNNLSIASGPQVVVNDDRLGDGEDGEQMYPWKRWHTKADPFGNNTEKAIEFFNTASNSQELLQVYLAFSNMADETSAIPKFMTGTPPQGGLGRTASGLSMLMQNSSKILQTVASNIDRDVIEPILNSLFDMVMLTDDTGLLTGEEKIRVLGVAVAQQRETQRARQLEALQITANPIDMSIIGPKGRAKILRNVFTEIGMPGEDIVPSDDEMDAKEKQQQAMAAMQAQGGGQPGSPPGAPGPGQPPTGAPHPPGGAPPPGGPGAPQQPQVPTRGGQPQGAPPGAPQTPGSSAGGPRMNLVNQGGPT
jgi:hypothetical protein